MPFNPQLPELQNDLRVVVLPNDPEHGVALEYLGKADRERFDRLTNDARRAEFRCSRRSLQQVLPEAKLAHIFYENGKPTLPAGEGFASLSHCKDASAAVYSRELEVGIDLEVPREQIFRIARRFVRDDERALVDEFGERDAYHFIWGIKESLFKLYGHGGVDFTEHLQITHLRAHPSGWVTGMAWIWATCPQRPAPIACYVQAIFSEGHYLCLASHRADMPAIESPRLRLREWRISDAPWLYRLNQNPAVIRYTGDSGFRSEIDARALITSYENYQRDGYGRWMVELKDSGTPIGWCGLKKNPWGIDLGFRFFEDNWGQGYATEAARVTLEKAKELGLQELVGRALENNVASVRVLEKLGFRLSDRQPVETYLEHHSATEEQARDWQGQDVLFYTFAWEKR